MYMFVKLIFYSQKYTKIYSNYTKYTQIIPKYTQITHKSHKNILRIVVMCTIASVKAQLNSMPTASCQTMCTQQPFPSALPMPS